MDVLVLDRNYQFIQFISVKRAIKLLFKEKIEVIKAFENQFLRTIDKLFPIPSVVRLLNAISLKIKSLQFTRNRIFIRDNRTCQYCGKFGGKITVDHIVPQSKGGKSTWENCVACCDACNKRKGDKPLQETGMILLSIPKQPGFLQFKLNYAKNHKNFHQFKEFLYT